MYDKSELLKRLYEGEMLTKDAFRSLFMQFDQIGHEGYPAFEEKNDRSADQDVMIDKELMAYADAVRRRYYGDQIYIRGLIEISNHCKNNCYYCGIRAGNRQIERYRLTKEEILSCCEKGYASGFRTFVFQGGEELTYANGWITDLIEKVKGRFPDCAVTLSLGEWEKGQYQEWFDAGADRYLLRHETIRKEHYAMLHPAKMSYSHRMKCLETLQEIGYQVGCGFMVGTPGQTTEDLIDELFFARQFDPDMIGIGPFIPHNKTPFREAEKGSVKRTLQMLALLRLTNQRALLPATTALKTIHPEGQKMGLLAGANVVMPNLSPETVRGKYELYAAKACTGTEAAEGLLLLKKEVNEFGYCVAVDPGHAKQAL